MYTHTYNVCTPIWMCTHIHIPIDAPMRLEPGSRDGTSAAPHALLCLANWQLALTVFLILPRTFLVQYIFVKNS